MDSKSKELELTIDIAQQAGALLMSYVGQDLKRNIKRHQDDFSTEADLLSEEFIISHIKKHFPNDAIVAEESGEHTTEHAPYTWIIDPLDGTYNFAHSQKNFGVMISRFHGPEVEMAVVYDPVNKILASAERGKGVWMNGQRIALQPSTDDSTLFSIEKTYQDFFHARGIKGVSYRSAITSTINVLAGDLQGEVGTRGAIWDYAPPALMFAEAGLKVSDLRGQAFTWDGQIGYDKIGIIAGHPESHQKLLAIWQEWSGQQ